MNTASTSTECRFSYSEAYKPSKKTWFVLLGVVFLYFYILLFFPKIIRYFVFAAPVFISMMVFMPNPRNWLLLLPVVVTFGNGVIEAGPFYSSVATVAVLASVIWYLSLKIAGFRNFPRLPVPVYIVLFAFLAQLASVFVSLHSHNSLVGNTLREGNKIYFSALLIPLVYDWFGRGNWFEKMLKCITLMLLAMSLYGIYQYNYGNLDATGEQASGYDISGRVYATILGGPNSYSGVLELLVPSVLASMFFFKSRAWKFTAFAAVILGIQNVLYTFSRGGFLTVTVSCLIYLVYRYRKKIWVPVISLLLFAGVLVANAEEFTRQLTLLEDTRSLILDTSLLHRYTSYKGFIAEIQKDPVCGVGWGSSEFFHGRTSLYSFWEVRHEDSVDKINRFGGLNSLVLEMPLKGGIMSAVSLLLLFAAIGVASIKFLKKRDNNLPGMGFICGLAAFSVHQAVDNLIPWPQTGAFFWLIFALLLGAAYPCCDKETDSV